MLHDTCDAYIISTRMGSYIHAVCVCVHLCIYAVCSYVCTMRFFAVMDNIPGIISMCLCGCIYPHGQPFVMDVLFLCNCVVSQ